MDIGPAKRVIEIEPLVLPVPDPAREAPLPAVEPARVPVEPDG